MRTTRLHTGWLSLSLLTLLAGCGAEPGTELSSGEEGDTLLTEVPEFPGEPEAQSAPAAASTGSMDPLGDVQSLTASSSGCLTNPSKSVISGSYTSQYGGPPKSGSTVDARGASWTMKDGWLSTPKASTDVCWVGGTFKLTVDDTSLSPTAAWANIWHHDGGETLKYNNTNWTFDGVAISHVGDAFNLSTGAQNFTIRNSHISDVRDDCVQNDDMHAGSVYGNFFDGCYSGFSARASSGVTPNDGHNNSFVIAFNLIWIKPMRSVYKGDSPGNAHLIKWEQTNPQLAPKLVFAGNMVRVGKLPFQTGTSGTAFYFPPGTTFTNNVLYWDGPGTAPKSLTDWFNAAHNSRVVYTSTEWDKAVSDWRASHPDVK